MGTHSISKGQHYINGNFTDGSIENFDSFDSINPTTQKVIGFFPKATASEVESTYYFARDSF